MGVTNLRYLQFAIEFLKANINHKVACDILGVDDVSEEDIQNITDDLALFIAEENEVIIPITVLRVIDQNKIDTGKVKISPYDVGITCDGYGESDTEDGCGYPVVVDWYYEHPMVYVMANINIEGPTHRISLKEALESNREMIYDEDYEEDDED